MASPGEIIKGLAKVLGVPAASVAFYDRVLVEADLRTKGGRGWAAPHYTPRDAAHLLTAILGSGQVHGHTKVREAAATVQRYEDTRPHQAQSSKKLFAQAGIVELAKLPASHSFIDALEALFQSAQNGFLAAWMSEQMKGMRAKKHQVMPLIEIAASSPGTLGDIRIAGVVEGMTAQVRYAAVGPWSASKQAKRSAKALPSHEVSADLAQYRSVTAQTIVDVAEILARRGQ